MELKKQILIISGSPRKGGNSDLLCDEFARGAQENGAEVEKVYLKDLKINFCNACYGCRNTGKCVQKDDMEELLRKMINSDVIVLATPVYFYSVDGQMKTMIDRTLPVYTKIRNKDFYFITTAAAAPASMERTVDALRGFTDCLPGAEVKGVIRAGGVYLKGEVNSTSAVNEAYKAGLSA